MTQEHHQCHVRGCTVDVPPKLLMCRRHWYACPSHLRSEVWAHYRPGQEEDKSPTKEYLTAARAACDAVETKMQSEKEQPQLL